MSWWIRHKRAWTSGSHVLVLLLVWPICLCAGQGLPLPGKSGLSARDYSRVRAWAAEGQSWRSSYAAGPGAACNAQSGLCAAHPGSEDYGKLLVATSPADYDARSGSGSFDPISPVQDQRPCQAAVAFAVSTAAEAAVASALHVNASAVSLSQQDLQFCPDSRRSCQEPWDVRAAVERLINGSIVTNDCLPYTAATTDDPAKLCNYRCKDQPKLVQGGKFRMVSVRSPLEGQRQIRRYGSFVTRFNVYQDFLAWVRDVAPADPTAVYDCPNGGQPPSEGHAVAVVGYNNTDGHWLVKNSWGTSNGDKGFFRVKFGVCGMLAPGDTMGVSFIPAQPVSLNVTGPVPDPLPVGNRSRTCYNYTAQAGDFVSKVADAAVIRVGQLLQDNNGTLKDLDKQLAGTQLVLCDPDPSSVSTGPSASAAAAAAAAKSNATAAANSTGANATAPHAAEGARPMPAAPEAVLPSPELSPPTPPPAPPPAQPAVATPAEEVAALLALKEALGYKNPEWAGDEPCGQDKPWPGLYCNPEGRVYMIDLSSKGLSGTLSDDTDLSKVPFLQALWLFDNPTLSGSLPSSWSQFQRLRELSLYGCSLTGSLPGSWGGLKRLRHLYLHNNKLTGSLPDEWGNLGALINLGLAINEFSGSIPNTWSGMRSLKSISLFDNAAVAGCLPSSWINGQSGRLTIQLARPAENIRPLAGTKLCRTCSDTCRAAAAAGAALGSPSSSSSSKSGRVVPPKDPGAAEASAGRVVPPLNPVKDPSKTAAGGGPKPLVVPPLPAVPLAQVVLPAPAGPSTLPGPAVGMNASTGLPAGLNMPPVAKAAPEVPAVNTSSAQAAKAVNPAKERSAVPAPSIPLPAATASRAADPAGPTGPAAPKLEALGGTPPGSAAPAVPPAPTGLPDTNPAAVATTQGPLAKPAPPAVAPVAAPAEPAVASAPPAITPAGPAAAAAAPLPPVPTPPTPAAAPPPAAPLPPNPVGSLPVPVDPSLTVVRDHRKPNFQDMQLSGRRRRLQLRGAA